MSVCTFFGHSDCPERIRPQLYAAIEACIVHHHVDTFYVGNQGQFDAFVRRSLQELCGKYPHVRYAVVLAYMPGKRTPWEDYGDTMLPEGIERIPRRYAISWRNDWMLKQADYVITFVTHSMGDASKFAQKAKRKKKTVRNIA